MQASSASDVEDYKPDLEPVKTICRCCLTTEKQVLSVSLFASLFFDLAGLNVSESDGLPPWLCFECSALLRKSVGFKHKVLKANTMLCDYLMRCAPFPIDAVDPELSKYAAPNLNETHILTFDNMGKAKLGFQKVLEHEKQQILSELDAIPIDVQDVKKADNASDLVKVEMDTYSDFEDSITLDEYRATAEKPLEEEFTPVAKTEDIKAEEDKPKKKKRSKKKDTEVKPKQPRKRLIGNTIVYRISEETKMQIITLYEKGVPVGNIADDLGVTRNTVYLWANRWKNEGTIKPRISNGRPRKTTEAQDQALVNTVRFQNYLNTKLLAAPLEVSKSTIRRRLQESGVKKKITKDILTDWQKEERVKFARNYLNYDFQNVAFLSEKLFVVNNDGLTLTSTNVKHEDSIVVGFFGVMNANSPVLLTGINSKINTDDYIGLLRDTFLPSVRKIYPGDYKIIFAHDFSTIHNSRKVDAFIQSQKNLEYIKLPPKSLDLNPMDKLWVKIIEDLDLTTTTTNHELWTHIMNRWNALRGTDICATAVNSMRERLQAVIDANGAYTKFHIPF